MEQPLDGPELDSPLRVDRDLFMVGVVGALGAEINVVASPPSIEHARPEDLVGADRGQGYSYQWVSDEAAPVHTRLAS